MSPSKKRIQDGRVYLSRLLLMADFPDRRKHDHIDFADSAAQINFQDLGLALRRAFGLRLLLLKASTEQNEEKDPQRQQGDGNKKNNRREALAERSRTPWGLKQAALPTLARPVGI
ncbi:MAG: hypothetical protein HZA67_00555 [Rhodospirillales bacterium]|nr:hypothetical protein [Rhodospirillales bacterium]